MREVESRSGGRVTTPVPPATPLVTPESKIRPPVPHVAVVPRVRLLDRLAATRFQIAAIEAPGGFGKSTFAAQFAEESVLTAWATLDATDADPMVLVATVLSALDHAGTLPPGTPIDWTGLLSGDEPSFSRYVVPRFRRTIESSAPATVVLDQVDQATGAQARALLTALVDSLPAGSSIALVGRSLRELPLALWRGQGRLVTITAGDLKLDEAETAAALRGFQGREPDPAFVREVAQRTDGWPVAVYLGAISDKYPAPDTGDLRDYFETEILARVDPDVVAFLRLTSPLKTLSRGSCAAVAGVGVDVAALLARAEASSLLVRRIQGPERSFSVHALLREHLLAEFAETDPIELGRVHARASAWCREHGLTDQAITHARLCGDAELLGATLLPPAMDSLLLGQGGRVRRWLDAVDEEMLAASPALSLAAAWTAVSYTEPEQAARWSLTTARLLGPDWADHLESSTVEPVFALLTALDGHDGWARAAALAEAAHEALPADDLLRIFAMLISGAFRVFAGDAERGVAVLELCRSLAASRSLWTTWTEAAAVLAVAHVEAGDLPVAADRAREARHTWDHHDREGALTTTAIVNTASALVACHSHDSAGRQHLQVALDLLPSASGVIPWLGVLIHAAAARCTAEGDEAVAVAHVRRGAAILRTIPASPFLSDCLESARQAIAREQRVAVLSPAERRVWRLLQTRMTLREIADALFLSPETVKSHTAAIYRKLGVANRREAQELGEALAPSEPSGAESPELGR